MGGMRAMVVAAMLMGGCMASDPCEVPSECCVHLTKPVSLDAVASYGSPSSSCLVAQDGETGNEAFSVLMFTTDKQEINIAGHCKEQMVLRLGKAGTPTCDLDFECLDDSDRVLMRFDGACGTGSFSFQRH